MLNADTKYKATLKVEVSKKKMKNKKPYMRKELVIGTSYLRFQDETVSPEEVHRISEFTRDNK